MNVLLKKHLMKPRPKIMKMVYIGMNFASIDTKKTRHSQYKSLFCLKVILLKTGKIVWLKIKWTQYIHTMSVVKFIIRIKQQIVVLCEYNNTPYKPTKEDCKT